MLRRLGRPPPRPPGIKQGKTLASLYRISMSSLHFTAIYMTFSQPIVSFGLQYVIILLMFCGVYGLAAVVSMLAHQSNANLIASIVCLFTAVFCGFGPNLVSASSWGIMFLFELSFNKWAVEAFCGCGGVGAWCASCLSSGHSSSPAPPATRIRAHARHPDDQSVSFYSAIYRTDFSASIWGYTLGRTGMDLGMGFMLCVVYRIVAYALMLLLNRDKQR